jgi:hypothetical protein
VDDALGYAAHQLQIHLTFVLSSRLKERTVAALFASRAGPGEVRHAWHNVGGNALDFG